MSPKDRQRDISCGHVARNRVCAPRFFGRHGGASKGKAMKTTGKKKKAGQKKSQSKTVQKAVVLERDSLQAATEFLDFAPDAMTNMVERIKNAPSDNILASFDFKEEDQKLEGAALPCADDLRPQLREVLSCWQEFLSLFKDAEQVRQVQTIVAAAVTGQENMPQALSKIIELLPAPYGQTPQIGRASCRERV